MLIIGAMDTTLAGLVLGGAILISIVALTVVAGSKDSADTQKNMFGVIGVLVGILAGGGVGTIIGSQAGQTAADEAAANVKSDVQQQVNKVSK